MKKIVFILICISLNGFSQSSSALNTYVAGRYLGWDANSSINPLLFKTVGINRMKLNGNYTSGANQYAIDGFTYGATPTTINTSGYLLLGQEVQNGTFFNTKGAFSMLHLNGDNGAFVQELGYRPWMRTGITLTDNQDLSYFGLRQVGEGFDITETTLTWSDNSSTANGPDDFVFRFTGGNWSGSATTTNTDLRTISDFDGMHIGRFTGDGLFGLGNTFGIQETGVPANLYVRPQSIFHLSYDRQAGTTNEKFGFMQVTLRDAALARGTGETEFDGLRFGIDNDVLNTAGTTYLNSYLHWQENTPFIVQTDWDNAAGGVEAGERIRVSTTASPGVPATMLNAANTTRVAIPYNGNVPITTPYALFNLGTNPVSNFSRYMDDGVLTSLLSTNLFTGISPVNYAKAPASAIVGFGGSDLVFMNSFTSSNLVNNDNVCVRVNRETNNVGIGNFGPLGSITNSPSERIDVEGNGRFRDIPEQGGQSLILGLQISTTNPNDVELSRLSFPNNPNVALLGNGTFGPISNLSANNGNSVSGNNVVLGQNVNQIGSPAILLSNRQIPLNNFNILYTGSGRIGIGNNFTSISPIAKMDIRASSIDPTGLYINNTNNMASIPLYDLNKIENAATGTLINQSLVVLTSGNPTKRAVGINTSANTNLSPINVGIEGLGIDAINSSIGGQFAGSRTANNTNNTLSIGVLCGANRSLTNFGISTRGGNPGDITSQNNYGVYSQAIGGAISYGIYAEGINGLSINRAGYFNGIVESVTGTFISDQQFKDSVQPLNGSLNALAQLNPVEYVFDVANYPQFNFTSEKQFGFIAQEVEQEFPNLVYKSVMPAKIDSVGNVISPETPYKSLNYIGLIPINTQAIKELNAIVTAQATVIDSLSQKLDEVNMRLSKLENWLSNLLPSLCEANASYLPENQTNLQYKQVDNVKLSSLSSIVLYQNNPNPFNETTDIMVTIPAEVKNAQLKFYSINGTLIKEYTIEERGTSKLKIDGNELINGIYTYSLIIDGKEFATKKMIKQ